MHKRYPIIAFIIILSILMGWILFNFLPTPHRITIPGPIKNSQPVALAQIGKPFSLLDQNNQMRTKDEFKGKIILIYFGYTYCPDICPTTLYNITDALIALGPKAQYIQTLFITVDPHRDNQQHLKEFMTNFHPSILALTGSEPDINKVISDYKVYAQKMKPQDSSIDYLIDHTSIIYIYDRKGNFINSFNHKTAPDQIVNILTPYL